MRRRIPRSLNNASGIYCIRSLVSGKCYIGSAVHFRKRYNCHRNTLKAGVHANARLQNFVNKYGLAALEFVILEQCSPAQLIEREQAWIDQLHPFFNICQQAGNRLGCRATAETCRRISEAKQGRTPKQPPHWKRTIRRLLRTRNVNPGMRQRVSRAKSLPVGQYDLQGVFLRTWPSAKAAALALGLSRSDINACCHGHKGTRRLARVAQWQWRFYHGSRESVEPYTYRLVRHVIKNTRRLPDVTKVCANCQRDYQARGSTAWRSRFCSAHCRQRARYQRLAGN